MIHLEGMGVMGCLIACKLADEGIPFTWHDRETNRVSWKISTGAILPFGDERSISDLFSWHSDVFLPGNSETNYGEWMRRFMTMATYCYVTENPPHNGRRAPARVAPIFIIGPIKVSNRFSIHLDVQSFVHETRQRFSSHRTSGRERGQQLIVTHGFHRDTIHKWSWGWSARVKIRMSPKLKEALRSVSAANVPCCYFRRGFQLPYLYPVGATGWYYAGTTLITQNKPQKLEVQPKFDTWKQHIEEYSEGHVTIRRMEPRSLGQGWRPMAHPEADNVYRDEHGRIIVSPQYGSGIRWFPSTYEQLKELL